MMRFYYFTRSKLIPKQTLVFLSIIKKVKANASYNISRIGCPIKTLPGEKL